VLQGVVPFSAKKNSDPLLRLDDGAAHKEWLDLTRIAMVTEAMLVALCHMQVNVCYVRRYAHMAVGMSAFRTNIIAFPQEALELNKLEHYWSCLKVHDIVNVRLTSPTGERLPPQRARVLALEAGGVRICLGDSAEEHLVQTRQIEQRVCLPWQPTDLKDYFIVFRRKHGRDEEYVEDLRVRRSVIKRILRLLTTKGFYRPDQGEECRHYYYSACDILPDHEIDELFPEEDFVPPNLNFQDHDEHLPESSMDQHMFVQWLAEGQHDCDVARTLGSAWARDLSGAGNETTADFFHTLLHDYQRDIAEASDDPGESVDAPESLPIPWLANFIYEVCSPFSFELETTESSCVPGALTAVPSCIQFLRRTSRSPPANTLKRQSMPGRGSSSNPRPNSRTGASRRPSP
jgi:hypothetical protein